MQRRCGQLASAPLADLPPECFELMGLELRDWLALAQVCRRMRALADARLSGGGGAAAACFDIHLSLVPGRRLPAALETLGRRAPRMLRSLTVHTARVDGSALAPLFGPALTRLVLRGCTLREGGASAEGPFGSLGQLCPRLQHLDLTGSAPVSCGLLASFQQQQQQEQQPPPPAQPSPEGGGPRQRHHPLRVLVLAGVGQLSTSGLAGLPPLPHLELLDLGGAAADAAAAAAGGASLEPGAIADGLLRGSKGGRPYPALRSLGLCRQSRLSPDDVMAAARALLPGLKALDLGGALRSRDQLIDAFEEDGGAIAIAGRLWTLQALDLRWDSTVCHGLEDEDIAALAASAPHLRRLDLSGHASFSDVGLLALASSCPRLESLTLSRQRRITARGLRAALQALPCLRALTAVRCPSLHKRALKSIERDLMPSGDGGGRVRFSTERSDDDAVMSYPVVAAE